MKKLLAFFMALIMLLPMTLCVNAEDSAPEVPVFGNTLDNIANAVTPPSGSPKFSDSSTGGSTNLAGTDGRAYKLDTASGSDVSTASSILPIYPRNTKGTNEAVGAIASNATAVDSLVRGTYTISIWLRSNDIEKFASANTKLAVELLPSTVVQKDFQDAAENGTPYKPGDVGVGWVTLFSSDNDQYIDTYTNANPKTWYKYSAQITVKTSFSQMCIWAIVNGTETQVVSVYIDELSIEKTSEHTTPVLAGAQISGKYDHIKGEAVSVRFLGAVDSYENYEALGFRIAYRYSDGSGNPAFTYRDIQSNSVYTSVLEEDSEKGKHVEVQSINYGMKYFYATSIDGIEIKTSGQYEFIITPVAIEKDTHKELVLESCRYVITAEDGTFNMSNFARVDMDTLPTDYASVNSQMK